MSGDDVAKAISDRQRAALRALFDNLSDDPETLLAELKMIRTAFQEMLASQCEAPVNAIAREKDAPNLADRLKLTRWVDSTTRDLGLITRSPRDERPAVLVADLSPGGNPRYVLVIESSPGRLSRTSSSAQFRELQLMPMPAELSPLLESYRPKPQSRRR